MSAKQHPLGHFCHRLASHPYLCVIVACGLLLPFGLCQKVNITLGGLIYALVVIAVILAVLVFLGGIGSTMKKKLTVLAVGTLFGALSLFLFVETGLSSAVIFFMPLIMTASLMLYMKIKGVLSTRNFIMLMVLMGIVLRFVYILYTTSDVRQQDVGYWVSEWGHANYIEYWYNNGLKLPDFDVRDIWQYYHPPLHHWIMAALLRVFTFYGMDYLVACQALQILPLLYSSLIMVVCYRLFRFVMLDGTPLIVAMAFVCFHPTLVLMASYFNNDILSVLFMLSAMLWALRWYRAPRFRILLPVALCVGLGMMTKLSAWMVAPAIAALFLYVFIREVVRSERKGRTIGSFLWQFLVFGLICIPPALWWQVRNLLLFDVPLTYVPVIGEDSDQYLGNLSVWQRFFDFSGQQLTYVFNAFENLGAPYNDSNIFLGTIKSSLFGEGQQCISTLYFPQLAVIGPVLFWIAVPTYLMLFSSFFIALFRKRAPWDLVTRGFFGITFMVMLVSYISFCFAYPYTCTMHIRYIVPLIPLSAMGLGIVLRTTRHRATRYIAYALTGAFCSASAVLFIMIG